MVDFKWGPQIGYCGACGRPQFATTGGACCRAGHGGAETLDFPRAPAADIQDARTQALASRIAEAVAEDEVDGGCDIGAGLFGPRFSAIVCELATGKVPA